MARAKIKRNYYNETKEILKEINPYLNFNKWVKIEINKNDMNIFLKYNDLDYLFKFDFNGDVFSEIVTALTLANNNIEYIF